VTLKGGRSNGPGELQTDHVSDAGLLIPGAETRSARRPHNYDHLDDRESLPYVGVHRLRMSAHATIIWRQSVPVPCSARLCLKIFLEKRFGKPSMNPSSHCVISTNRIVRPSCDQSVPHEYDRGGFFRAVSYGRLRAQLPPALRIVIRCHTKSRGDAFGGNLAPFRNGKSGR